MNLSPDLHRQMGGPAAGKIADRQVQVHFPGLDDRVFRPLDKGLHQGDSEFFHPEGTAFQLLIESDFGLIGFGGQGNLIGPQFGIVRYFKDRFRGPVGPPFQRKNVLLIAPGVFNNDFIYFLGSPREGTNLSWTAFEGNVSCALLLRP